MDSAYIYISVAIIACVTMLLRVIPFLLFRGKQTPKYISFLGEYLPCAIIGMLVVYCLKGISFAGAPYGVPELASVALVIVLHVWKRNTLFSVITGTVCYMLLIKL